MSLIINPYSYGGGGSLIGLQTEFINAIIAAGAQASITLCVDAGDIVSTPNSTNQVWSNTTGVSGRDWYRGNSSSVEATLDPVLFGGAGTLNPSAYWAITNTPNRKFTTVNGKISSTDILHYPDSRWTLVAWWFKSTDSFIPLFSTSDTTTSQRGVTVFANSPSVIINKGSSPFVCNVGSSTLTSPTIDVWYYSAITVNLSSGEFTFCINGQTESKTITLGATPTSGTSSGIPTICAVPGDTDNTWLCAGGIACLATWNRVLSPTELVDIFTATRSRFGV